MATATRTLFIVEDDTFLNELYKNFCTEVLTELGQDLPQVRGVIKQAFSYGQAKQILDNEEQIDFISIDLALHKDEEDKDDRARAETDVSGMILLKELQQRTQKPLSVVVSGETLPSYATDAYRKYGVLAFYQKARFDAEEYKHAVKAALFYLEAVDLLMRLKTGLDLEVAERHWNRALQAAKIAGIAERDFPETIGEKIRLAGK